MVIIFVNTPLFTLDCRSLLASDKQRECRQTTINRRKKEKKTKRFSVRSSFFSTCKRMSNLLNVRYYQSLFNKTSWSIRTVHNRSKSVVSNPIR
jgi:hypothetical protein